MLGCLTLMTLDHVAGDDGSSPVDPLRRLVGEVYGPVEAGVDGVLNPILAVPHWLRSQHDLAADIDRLESENDQLRSELATSDYDRNRLQEYDDLTATAESIGYALVPARVIGIGPAQSFSRTVTIDAGSRAGLAPDMTVVNGDGLVGRVLRVTSTTATVLLVVDADSTVGGRVGRSMKVGFLHGRGDLGDERPARPRARRPDLRPGQGRDRGDVGQPGRRAVRLGRPGRPGRLGLLQPPRDHPARGHRAVRGLLRARRRRRRRARPGTDSDRGVIEADGSLR